jgi:hypothetical protein
MTTSVTLGAPAVRVQCTTTSTLSLTRELSAASGSPPSASASWHTNRNRVSAWRADPAWIVVNPVTPDDRRQQQRQHLSAAALADDRT